MDKKIESLSAIQLNKIIESNEFVKRGYDSNDNYIEIYYNNDGNVILSTEHEDYFSMYKKYYPNGNIKRKGLGINTSSSPIGTWYEFDESGKLIKEINYDEPFTFTFEDILKFCKEQNITIEKGYISQTGWHNIITRKVENGKPTWQIEHLKTPSLIEIITLDGITGEILKKETEKRETN